jgi:EAL domain-containing protein (putative c-di-GMP-specific phosphodiesterase class I)
LKEAGIGMSIDDFGIGASSLQTLKDFPVDHIKIDRSFVDRVVRGGEEAMIARAVISLGHSLNMTVIAEGVETIEQLEFLRAYQCDQIQGNYFSAPITQAGLQALMEAKTMLRFR